jgi:hypothetical protein
MPMKPWKFAWLPLAAFLVLPRPADAAAPGALEGVGLICSAMLEATGRQPLLVGLAKEEGFAAIEQVLEIRGYDFGSGKARGLALIQAAFITAVTRNTELEVQTKVREIRDICVDAVLTGRLSVPPE